MVEAGRELASSSGLTSLADVVVVMFVREPGRRAASRRGIRMQRHLAEDSDLAPSTGSGGTCQTSAADECSTPLIAPAVGESAWIPPVDRPFVNFPG